MLRSLHRWLGLVFGAFAVVAAATALCLNHRDLILGDAPSGGGLYSQYLKDLAVDPRDPRRMVAGTDRALHLSTDGGRTWEQRADLASVEDVEFHAGTFYAAGRMGTVLQSQDGGATWTTFPFAEDVQIAGLSAGPEGLTLLTSRGVYRPDGVLEPRPPQPQGNETARAVVRTVYALHDGTFWGRWGVLITDLTSLAVLVLVATGYRLGLRTRRSAPREPRPARSGS